jgi:hypothetical protein
LEGTPDTDPVTANVAISAPTILVYLKDGTTLAANDYWMADGQFHYRVKYGGESSVGMDELDLQRTVDENAKRGVRFSLKPKPVTSTDGSVANRPAVGSTTAENRNSPWLATAAAFSIFAPSAVPVSA